jgi:hypothetical protein
MSKTNKERILDYLWSIAPERATNSQIRAATGISSHQQVYLLTQELMRTYIRGERRGNEWVFWSDESLAAQFTSPGRASPQEIAAQAGQGLTPGAFEKLAQHRMSEHFGVSLAPGTVPGVPKEFDLVSPDKAIVGDAKYFTLVRGQRLPPAKFSVIAEYVWLLEKTGAPTKFLVFGNDRQVPELWLTRYGKLAFEVAFYFLADDATLEQIHEAGIGSQASQEG